MAGGLVGTGRAYKQQAIESLMHTQEMEQKRHRINEQMERRQEAAQLQTIGTAAGVGAAVGASTLSSLGWAAGPVGALAGAAIGFLATELF